MKANTNLEVQKAANALHNALRLEFHNVLEDGDDGSVMSWLDAHGYGDRYTAASESLPDDEFSEAIRDTFCHCFEEYCTDISYRLKNGARDICFPENSRGRREYGWRNSPEPTFDT